MILIDVNLLIYATIPALEAHARVRPWWERQIASGTRIALPWPSLLGFVRLTTKPRLFEPALTFSQAWEQVEAWLALPNSHVPVPGEGHADLLTELIRESRPPARMIDDAHLAALAIEHGLTLCSGDADFGRFRGLRWHNPVTAADAGL